MAIATESERAQPDQVLTGNLAWLLSRASHALSLEMTAAMERIGLAPRGHCVLAVAMQGERTQTDLADEIGLDKTTMVTTVDGLEAAGLAERKPAPHDRRARVISVTAAGRRKVAQADKIRDDVQRQVLESLPAAERKALIESLSSLLCGPLSAPAECEHRVRRRAG